MVWYFHTCFKGDTGVNGPVGYVGLVGERGSPGRPGLPGQSGEDSDCRTGEDQFLLVSLVTKFYFSFLHTRAAPTTFFAMKHSHRCIQCP